MDSTPSTRNTDASQHLDPGGSPQEGSAAAPTGNGSSPNGPASTGAAKLPGAGRAGTGRPRPAGVTGSDGSLVDRAGDRVLTLLTGIAALLAAAGAMLTSGVRTAWSTMRSAGTATARQAAPSLKRAGAGTRRATVQGARRTSTAVSSGAARARPAAARAMRQAGTQARPLLRRVGAATLTVFSVVGGRTLRLSSAAASAVRAALLHVGGATLRAIGAAEHAFLTGLAAVGARTLLLVDRADTQVAMRVGDVARTTTAVRRNRQAAEPDPVYPAEAALPAAAWEPEPEPPLLSRAAVGAGGVLFSALATVLVLVLAGALVLGPVTDNASGSVEFALTLPDDAALAALEERSVIYAGDGSVLSVMDREVDRDVVALETVPQHIIDAVVTAEDRKFWDHPGYDVEGIGRALIANVEAGEIEQGGSTITQQLAKSQVGTERTLDRKVSELLYAMALEERFTKEELLEQYLNYVYFGANSYGIAAAAEEFFHKSYRDLTADEAALLAANIRSPNSTNPRERPEVATARRNAILSDMVRQGYLPASDLPELQARPLGVQPPLDREKRIPHVVDSVVREFLVGPQYAAFGATAEQREDALYRGGLRIHTSVVPAMQTVASEVIEAFYPRGGGGPTAAIAAVEPATGRILAAEGGVNYADEQYDLATQGRRQPGSAFKPFVYATALQMGFPQTVALEGRSPTYFAGICGWARVNPPGCGEEPTGVNNYGGASYGRLDMRRALINSVNTATAQLMLVAGPDSVAETARRMGINMEAALRRPDGTSPVNAGIALGGFENGTTPLEMASGYATFANGGVRVPPHFIDRIEDGDGTVVYTAEPTPTRVLEPPVNAAMVDIMQGVVSSGTGTRARLPGWQAAGKTGTTQRNADAWFVGYVPVLSTAVWVGHPEGQVPMRGATGGALAAPVWREFMSRVLEGVEPVAFPDVDYPSGRVVEAPPVAVPDVRGMMEAQARQVLSELKLVPAITEVASDAPEGTVLWQSPRGGTTELLGANVELGVSTGQAPPPPEPEEPEEPEDSGDEGDEGDDGDSDGGDEGDGGDGGESEGGESDGGESDGGDGGDSEGGDGGG